MQNSRLPRLIPSSATSPSLSDWLATACHSGDLPSAKAAVAEGASVNEKGKVHGLGYPDLPLAITVSRQHHDVVVWLLSCGADPNGYGIMFRAAAMISTSAVLQLLVDVGGDVNRESHGRSPLYWALTSPLNSEEMVRVLLAQPSLDCHLTYQGKTPEQSARDKGKPALADMIAQEVSGKGLPVLRGALLVVTVCVVAVAGRSRDERHWYGHCLARFITHVPAVWA